MECHQRLRILRKEYKLTQRAAGRLLQKSESAYRSYESGQRQIPLDELLVLGRYFDLSMDYLSGASDVRKPFPER